jgi:hypothetical protein
MLGQSGRFQKEWMRFSRAARPASRYFSFFSDGDKKFARRKKSLLPRRFRTSSKGLFPAMEMLGEGLEPTHLAVPDPKSGASASSATRAFLTIRRSLKSELCEFSYVLLS